MNERIDRIVIAISWVLLTEYSSKPVKDHNDQNLLRMYIIYKVDQLNNTLKIFKSSVKKSFETVWICLMRLYLTLSRGKRKAYWIVYKRSFFE